jgi:myo-inositol 2-dehydrogenase/D-chiro-inositol 1-dehydrogenase
MMTGAPLAVGLIGTGRIGRIHAANLALHVPGARLAAVADVRESSAAEVGAQYGVPVLPDAERLLAHPGLDAVAICSSTDTHADLIVQAAAHGKHIFCEKPIALDLPSIDRALAAAQAAGVALMVGFNRRYHPNFRRIRERVAAGEIGTPHLVRITSRDSAPPPAAYVRVSGGIFLDMTIHDFDMARYLLADEVTEVYAAGAVLAHPAIGEAGDVDTAVVVLRCASGALCTIDNSREAVYGYDQRIEVFGAGGMLACDNRFPDSVVRTGPNGRDAAPPYFAFFDIYRESYIAEMEAFIQAIRQGTPPPVTGADGRAPLVIGLAATRSLREGRPVRLSEIG